MGSGAGFLCGVESPPMTALKYGARPVACNSGNVNLTGLLVTTPIG